MITACRKCGGCGAIPSQASGVLTLTTGGTYVNTLTICDECGGSGQIEKKPQGATP